MIIVIVLLLISITFNNCYGTKNFNTVKVAFINLNFLKKIDRKIVICE